MKKSLIVMAILGLFSGALYYNKEKPKDVVATTDAPQTVLLPEAKPPLAATSESLSARVDALTRARPVDALAAYKILAACAQAVTKEACGDISPGQIASRRVALQKAAEAGVHGAAMLWIASGPDDYALHGVNSTDPVSKEWLHQGRKALEAGARTGDRFSLMSMVQISDMPTDGTAPDLVQALMYWTAVVERNPNAAFAKELERRAKELPPEQAAKAIADGRLLAQSFKPEGEQQ